MMRTGPRLSLLCAMVAAALLAFGVARPARAAAARELIVGFARTANSTTRDRAVGEAGASVDGSIPALGAYRLKLRPGEDASAVAARLDGVPGVRYVEPIHRVHALGLSTDVVPNDPDFAHQWGLSQAQFPQAWDVSQGSGQVIAVVDTGLDPNHPDLITNLWSNPTTIFGHAPGRIHGWNFVHTGGNPAAGNANIDDGYGHGTHVAGIAAAATDNGMGVAGAAPLAKIMVVKALDDTGNGDDFDVAAGIRWAADNGATVINLSLGGTDPSPTLDDACGYAHAQGAVVVAAIGNEATSTPSIPAASPGVLAVAATEGTDMRVGFSNFENSLSVYRDMVAAPGYHILSTLPTHSYALFAQAQSLNYGYLSGTSMAAPFVAGLAALVRAQNPGLTVDQVKQRIESSADSVGFWRYYGSGRVNAFAALDGTPSAYPAPTNHDPREPNDTTATASLVTPEGSTIATSPPDAYLFPAGDRDFYAIDAPRPGTLSVTMAGAPDLDPAIAVLNSSGADMTVANAGGTNESEHLSAPLASPGRYYVVAYDAFGGWAVRPYGFSLSFAGDVTPPAVRIASPANNSYVGNIVRVTAAPTDNVSVARVEFLPAGTATPVSATGPYTFRWNLSSSRDGSRHTVKATAVDTAGNRSTPAQLAVTVDRSAPSVYKLSARPSVVREGRAIAIRYAFYDRVSRRGRVRLSVLDARGRVRRDLGSRAVKNGTHSATFDGRASSGRALSAGRYRIRAAGTDARGLGARLVYVSFRVT